MYSDICVKRVKQGLRAEADDTRLHIPTERSTWHPVISQRLSKRDLTEQTFLRVIHTASYGT